LCLKNAAKGDFHVNFFGAFIGAFWEDFFATSQTKNKTLSGFIFVFVFLM